MEDTNFQVQNVSWSLKSDLRRAREAMNDSRAKLQAGVETRRRLAAAAIDPADAALFQRKIDDLRYFDLQVRSTRAKVEKKVWAANAEAVEANQLLEQLEADRERLASCSLDLEKAAKALHRACRFTRFASLPTEIRLMIWELALSEVSVWRGFSSFLYPGKAALKLQGPKISPHEVGLSCREARSTMERLYVKVLRKRCRTHGPWDENSWDKSTGYWINPHASIVAVPNPLEGSYHRRLRWKRPPTGSRVLEMYPIIQHAVIPDTCAWYSTGRGLEPYGEVLLSHLLEIRTVFIFNFCLDGTGRHSYLQREGVRDYLSDLIDRGSVPEGPIHEVDDWTSALEPHLGDHGIADMPGRCAIAAARFRDALLQHPGNDADSAPERQLTVHFIFPRIREHAVFTVKLHKKE